MPSTETGAWRSAWLRILIGAGSAAPRIPRSSGILAEDWSDELREQLIHVLTEAAEIEHDLLRHPGVHAGLTHASPRNVGARSDPGMVVERLLELSEIYANVAGSAVGADSLRAAAAQVGASLRN